MRGCDNISARGRRSRHLRFRRRSTTLPGPQVLSPPETWNDAGAQRYLVHRGRGSCDRLVRNRRCGARPASDLAWLGVEELAGKRVSVRWLRPPEELLRQSARCARSQGSSLDSTDSESNRHPPPACLDRLTGVARRKAAQIRHEGCPTYGRWSRLRVRLAALSCRRASSHVFGEAILLSAWRNVALSRSARPGLNQRRQRVRCGRGRGGLARSTSR